MNLEYSLYNEDDTKKMAKNIADIIYSKIVFLTGEMGAGKTTFTKHLVEEYGLKEEVYSPTFSIENRYNTLKGLVIHFDLYRLEYEEELDMIGFFDTLNENATILIEWADKFNIEKYIKKYINIFFTINHDLSRFVKVIEG